jgi:hypothetical protein
MEWVSRSCVENQRGRAALFCLLLLVGCNRSGQPAMAARPQTEPLSETPSAVEFTAPSPDDAGEVNYSFLVLGNSHTGTGSPFGQLEEMIRLRTEQPTTKMRLVGCAFLDDFAGSLEAIRTQVAVPNSYLVLQAQKYSQSGRHDYPVDVAVELARNGRADGCRVLMFPEWGQRGNPEEGRRVNRLHERIRDLANEHLPEGTRPVEVVPVGLVWDRILAGHPELKLHASDGNHSTRLGGTVTALAFYCWLFDEVPVVPEKCRKSELFVAMAELALATCREYRAAGCVTPE